VVQQLRETFPETGQYRYVILDRDSKFDADVITSFCRWLVQSTATAQLGPLGEASGRQFEAVEESASGSGASNVKLKAHLPLAQEDITRTVTLLDGESVAYVNTEVENLLAIDHPLSWAEHATTAGLFRGTRSEASWCQLKRICTVQPDYEGETTLLNAMSYKGYCSNSFRNVGPHFGKSMWRC
jgi:hypothetical protein